MQNITMCMPCVHGVKSETRLTPTKSTKIFFGPVTYNLRDKCDCIDVLEKRSSAFASQRLLCFVLNKTSVKKVISHT